MSTKKKKKTTTSKSKINSSGKSKNNKQNKNNKKSSSIINPEILSIILISISFLLFFSIYRDTDFILSSFLKSSIIYVFGFSAYIIPIFLLFLGSYMFVTKKELLLRKYIICFLIIIFLSSTFEILSADKLNDANISFFEHLKMASEKSGGFIGYVVGSFLEMLVGKLISATLLIVSILVSLFILFGKNQTDLSKYFKTFFSAVKKLINKPIKTENEDDEVIERDIILDDFQTDSVISNLNENTVSFSTSVNNKFKNINELNNTSYRKREKKVHENNNSEKSGFFRNKQVKQQTSKKINPFAKKPKVRIFDFTQHETETPKSALRNVEKIKPRNNTKDDYFVQVRKDNSYNDNFEQTINIDNSSSEVLDQAQIEHYENTIKSLKDELDRQMFIFQDSQKIFLEQKKVEKSLLTIINAQRETLEKQKRELDFYKSLSAKLKHETNNIQNTIETPINQQPQASTQVDISSDANDGRVLESTNITPITPIVEVNNSVDDNIDNFFEDDDFITSTLNSITADSFKIANEDTKNLDEDNAETPYTAVSFDIEEDDEYNEYNEDEEDNNELDNNTNFAQEIINEYNVGIPSTDAIMVDVLANNNLDGSVEIESYSDEYINQLMEDTKHSIEEIDKLNTSQTLNNTYEASNSSIFKGEGTPEYRQPIKPNFDKPKEEKYIYKYPTVDFLNSKPNVPREQNSKTELIANSKKLEATLKSFGVQAKVLEVSKGPSVTRYEIQPGLGVKVSKIANLSDDLALNLAAKSIRIQAPIPGKPAVGIEVPNETTETVFLREVLDDENFKNFKSKLAFGIGKDISGKIVVADLATMPHLLIAGATGAGKSVCVNTLITSIVYKSSPEEVKLLMIDPKVVELSVYNGIPHLLIPVVTDPKKASAALNWAVREMEKRYKLFADKNVRDLKGYNQEMIAEGMPLEPQIVIIIDELADLMMTASKEVEAAIIRIAQMARAAGIHLIIATQRPTADVITGLIKSNIPSRLAFSVSSGLDSKIILDETGAEKLLGKGDMLFKPMGAPEPYRIQGAFISDKEVESIVSFLKTDADHEQMREIIEEITSSSNPKTASQTSTDTVDEILEDVVEFIISQQKASTSLIQRKFRVGFNRAARIVDELEDFGVIGPDEGNKPRKVLMSMQEWDNKFKT